MSIQKGWEFEVYRRTKKGALMMLSTVEVTVKEGIAEEQARHEYETNLNEMTPQWKHIVKSNGETEIIDFSQF